MHKTFFSANNTPSEPVKQWTGKGPMGGLCTRQCVKSKSQYRCEPGARCRGHWGHWGTLGYTDTLAADTFIHRGAGWGWGGRVHWCVALAPPKTWRGRTALRGARGRQGGAGPPGSRSTTANKKRATLTQAGNVPARGGGEWLTAARPQPAQQDRAPGERGGAVT